MSRALTTDNRQPTTLKYLPYPPTSLPVRDLFILDHVPINMDDQVMEIGVGCGETTARLAGLCRRVVGVDVSRAAIDSLGYLKQRLPNMELVCVDVTGRDASLGTSFDRIVSMDTLEHVSDPQAYFGFIWRHLAEGGTGHVLFPNETPERMHGITRFRSEAELRAAVESAHGAVEIFRADLNRWARTVVAASYGWLRRLRPTQKGGASPQQFDQTEFFRRMDTW